jgi:hypothetical protein
LGGQGIAASLFQKLVLILVIPPAVRALPKG